MGRGYHYISPFIYPIPPREVATLTIGVDVERLVREASYEEFNGRLRVGLAVYSQGQKISEENLEFDSVRGKIIDGNIYRSFELDDWGYLEFSLLVDEPVFRRVNLQTGYAVLELSGGGLTDILPSHKYAVVHIIEQIQRTRTFCMCHSASLVDPSRGLGNACLVVNPYENTIVATLLSENGERMRERINAKSCRFLPMNSVLEDGVPAAIMITGSNRFPAWDVRYSSEDPRRINNVDHMEFYRGHPTHENVSVRDLGLRMIKRYLRKLGVRS